MSISVILLSVHNSIIFLYIILHFRCSTNKQILIPTCQSISHHNTNYSHTGSVNSVEFWLADHDCFVVGGAGSPISTRVASTGAGGVCVSVVSTLENWGITCDCTFLTVSIFTLVDRFFWRVCSDVFDNLSLNALSAICLKR